MTKIQGTQLLPGDRYRPILNVRIVVGPQSLFSKAVVDSGADKTLVPAELVQALGVDFSTLPAPTEDNSGAGGQFEVRRLSEGSVSWHGKVVTNRIDVAEPGHLFMVLLGREDFFAQYKVTFTWTSPKPTFVVEPLTKQTELKQKKKAATKESAMSARDPKRRRRKRR